ncbi:MAG: esterase family protein [Clostridia bacterium]|nr:esterase family protein [Clostridia bacterium]
MALLHVNFFSETLGMCTQMNVILPEGNKGQIGVGGSEEAGKWKVMYLLHGLSDDHTIWERRTSIERYVADKPMAVVMAETQRGWYTDMAWGFKWFTYFSEELPRICRRFFPNISSRREDTYVCGLSMGGYGALKLALSCPEKYGAAASLSGAVDVAEMAEQSAGANRAYWEDVFGPCEQVRGSKNDLFALASGLREKNAALPRLYMYCGLQDGLYWQNVRLRNCLRGMDYDLTYEEGDGNHSWKYWDEKIQSVLAWLETGKEEK